MSLSWVCPHSLGVPREGLFLIAKAELGPAQRAEKERDRTSWWATVFRSAAGAPNR